MRVLIVGQGGREHAIASKLADNPTVEKLFAAPGNAGIAELATCEPIAAADVQGVADFAERESIDLTVVGPEAPLVAGLVDEMSMRGLRVFGPDRAAALIEGSKAWAKQLCVRAGIPAPVSESFTAYEPARAYLDALKPPYVIKADGLAAGKGVTVAEDLDTAERALRASLVDRAFGEAGTRVLVEEFLEGREVSAIAITDGRTVLPMALAQDYKRAGDGDTGPNTGGMGAYSPVPFIDDGLRDAIVRDVLEPTVGAMADEGVRYRGVLYAGLMVTPDGPKVLEFNCRLGDPETQAILPRLGSDLGELLLATVEGNLSNYGVRWREEACVTVVLASGGYPGEHETGFPIEGLDEAAAHDDAFVFHAGTALRNGRVVTAGGRVLAVSALGSSLPEARKRAYEAASAISFRGMHYRKDIGAEIG
ncbi:MAG: phosphoribosylamine--glycine ligase [Actinomycetota bacterium]